MTILEKLQAVTDEIRKALPRLMEVGEGCLIKHCTQEDDEKPCYVIKRQDGGRLDGYWYIDYAEGDYIYRENPEKIKNEFKIIGKEPTLLDVLDWLNMNNENIYILTDASISVVIFDQEALTDPYAKSDCFIKDLADIDISKPYLKNQSEELINFLYNLKNQ